MNTLIGKNLPSFLSPPVFSDDEEKTRIAQILNSLQIIYLFMLFSLGSLIIPFVVIKKAGVSLLALVLFASLIGSRYLMVKGKVHLACQTLLLTFWGMIMVICVMGEGLKDMVLVFLLAVTVMSGLLLGRRFAGKMIVLSIIFASILLVLERQGILPFHYFPKPPLVKWLELTFSLVITGIVLDLALRSRERALIIAREELEERQMAEKALRQSEATYRLIAENVTDVIWTMNLDFEFTYVSPSVTRMRGFTVEEALAQSLPEIMTPSSLQKASEAMAEDQEIRRQNPEIGDRKMTLELEEYRKDGSRFWTENEISYLRGENQEIIGIVGVTRDISERKRIETERKKLEERLRRAEKMESLGRLAGGVAHDLNNVLGVLVGYSELLLMDIPEESPLRAHVTNILEAGQRGAAIIQDLLTLARRGVAVSEVVNLNQIISDLNTMPEFKNVCLTHPRVVFKFDLDKDLLFIKGSPVHLGKTLMNLAINAAEAISDQGEVRIQTENRYLDQPVQGYETIAEGDYVVLTISDNGQGIPEKDIGKIFEPFYTKKIMGRSGTGLGLAVVWGTVQDHNGYIDVQSVEGRGTVFTLFFPITRETITLKDKSRPLEAYQGHGESILVIDDVLEQRELATSMLSRMGYQVTSVSSGEEALDYLTSHSVDLLVLDMLMDPGMNGLETYQKVIEIHHRQKAVIVSGFSDNFRVKMVQDLGAGVYVRKPYVFEKIGLAVREELDRIR